MPDSEGGNPRKRLGFNQISGFCANSVKSGSNILQPVAKCSGMCSNLSREGGAGVLTK
jgi:hypothetical protein